MNTISFSKGFPGGYQWISVLKLIACLCFVNIYISITAHDVKSGRVGSEPMVGIQDWMLNPDILSREPNKATEK